MNPLQPSDKLIKKIFSKKQEAIDYFRENLPLNLVEHLDLENIQFGFAHTIDPNHSGRAQSI
jgi:hypothetical protein